MTKKGSITAQLDLARAAAEALRAHGETGSPEDLSAALNLSRAAVLADLETRPPGRPPGELQEYIGPGVSEQVLYDTCSSREGRAHIRNSWNREIGG